ncbi:Protein PIH1D3 [Histomonas meleagridis]|uniref:Protein PIH1D3 n=1 Tax=Histomonas meleagridis TaxID=135588 RepID=UPI003559B57C|nr:Protein PIH1D3 [Histomonas meleagridis]KAH0798036.1 Protein PIH1D3 [Histomonas meleagridis]
MFDEITPAKEEEEQQEEFQQVIEPKEKESFWDDDEITPIGFYKDTSDQRPEPTYTIYYRQNVGTEDVYLGLGMKTPSISESDTAVIKVNLDDTVLDDIDLNVQNGYLDLRCPKYRLTMKLDYPTRDNETQAKWNNDEKLLTIEIPLNPMQVKIVS